MCSHKVEQELETLEVYGAGEVGSKKKKIILAINDTLWEGPDVGQMLKICGNTLGSMSVMPQLSSMWAWRILTDLTQIIKSDFRALETWM